MLAALSIRDIVLIDKLDLSFTAGLTIFTGETGAGKSIILDALSLALGARGDGGLVRKGAHSASVTACFDLAAGPPRGRACSPPRIWPRTNPSFCAGCSSPMARPRRSSTTAPFRPRFCASLAARLVEIHGQHDERALLDPTAHRYLLDQFGGLLPEVREVTQLWERWRELDGKAKTLAQALELAERERDYLTAACQELNQLAPQPGEEESLATRRAVILTSGKVRADLEAASDALSPPVFPASKISGVLRRLERQPNLPENLRPILAALERVMIEADEARVAVDTQLRAVGEDNAEDHRGAAVQAPRHRAQAPRSRERASQGASALSGGPVQA